MPKPRRTPAGTLDPQLASAGLLSVHTADVGQNRESQRQVRLRKVAVLLAVPAAFLWYRVADGRPFDVIAFPHVDWLLFAPILFFVALIALLGGTQVMTGRSPHTMFRPEQLDVRLSDVVGIDPVKDEVIRSLNLFLAHETFARDMGGRPRRGLLFEGGPGTGKTHTAKAMAAEAGVPFLFASASSFQSSFYGATARKIRSYFKELRKAAAREGGAIGFIDEFDAIGGTRRGMEMTAAPDVFGCGGLTGLPSSYAKAGGTVTTAFGTSDLAGPVVNELLVQMQSFDTPTGMEKVRGAFTEKLNLLLPAHRQIPKPAPRPANIMLIASTNRADGLDPALMRPGRFDRRLTFEEPGKTGRRALLDHFLGRKSHHAGLDDPEQRDAIAAVTQGYTPAMIEGLLDEALVNAVRRGDTAMTRADIEHARLTTEVGMGQPTAYTDHERRLIATHEAGHTVAAWLCAPGRRLEVLTIVKRRDALGLLAHGDREDVYTRSRAEMTSLIRIAMGGLCAEEIWFGDVSTGPGSDLLYATNVAAQMIGACGMEGTLVSFAAIQNGALNDSNIVGRVLHDTEGRARVDALLNEQKAYTRALLDDNRHLVEALRDALLDRDELIGHEITDVLEAARERLVSGANVIDLRERSGDAVPTD
ncbi:MAG: cell division protease FtsH [Frankiaceae bacterium]|jgi:ATP-dependent Zn protease|nr:cell division protease FtsH [Frankiaceae bacterium]